MTDYLQPPTIFKVLPPRVVIFNRDYPVRVDYKPLHEYALEVDILHGEIGAIFKDGKIVERIVRDDGNTAVCIK